MSDSIYSEHYQSTQFRDQPRTEMRSSLGFQAIQNVQDTGGITDTPVSSWRSEGIVRGGSVKWSADKPGQVSHTGHGQSSSLDSLEGKSGLMATALNPHGSPVTSGKLSMKDTVVVGGMRATVESLLHAGLLQESDLGKYDLSSSGKALQSEGDAEGFQQKNIEIDLNESNKGDVDPALEGLDGTDLEQAKAFQKMAEEDGLDLASPKEELAVSKLIADVPQPAYDQAAAEAIAGGLEAVNWESVAGASGITVEEAKHRGTMAHTIMKANADRVTRSLGVENPDQFYWHLMQTDRPLFDKMQREFFVERKSTLLRAAAQRYVRG